MEGSHGAPTPAGVPAFDVPRIAAMVLTPFAEAGAELDEGSLVSHVHALLERGCTELIALGVIAEPASLSLAERIRVLDVLAATAPGVPLTAKVMGIARPDGLEEARALAACTGVHAIMVPVTHPDAGSLRAILVAAHEATGLPVVVQDYPPPTGVTIALDELLRALDGLGFVSAVKCEAPPTFWRIRRIVEELPVVAMSGLGGIGLVDDLRAGATALACGMTRPEAMARAMAMWSLGDEVSARRAVADVSALVSFEMQAQTSIGVRKEHWRRAGVIASSRVRSPTMPYPPQLDGHSAAHGYPA